MQYKWLPWSIAALNLVATPEAWSEVAPNNKGESQRSVTLEWAVEKAFADSPQLLAASARREEARGRLIGAETYPANPVLSASAASRRGMGRSAKDLAVSLSQELFIGGRRGNRIDASRSEMEAASADLIWNKRLLVATVHLAFIDALRARDLVLVAGQDLALARSLYELAEKGLAKGAATRIDVNVAAAELGRSEAAFENANGAFTSARAILARTMGMNPRSQFKVAGTLRAPLGAPSSLSKMLRDAQERGDVTALRGQQMANEARHKLARSEAWPTVTLQAFAEREADVDTILGGGLSIPLPLFDRNQGAIAETRARLARSRAELATGQLLASEQLVSAHARYLAAATAVKQLRKRVVGNLEENLALLQRAFDAGKQTWPEVLIIRRTFVDAQRLLTNAEADARQAWVALELASGQLPIPAESSERTKK